MLKKPQLFIFAFGCAAYYQRINPTKQWPLLNTFNLLLTFSRLIPLLMLIADPRRMHHTDTLKHEAAAVISTTTTLLTLSYADENNQALGLVVAFTLFWLAEQIISSDMYASNGNIHNPIQTNMIGSLFLAMRAAVLGTCVVEYSFDPTIIATFTTILLTDLFADHAAQQGVRAFSGIWTRATLVQAETRATADAQKPTQVLSQP